MVVSRLFGLFSADTAIDLGTSSTRLCMRGRGIVSEEPTYLAVKKGTTEVFDHGRAIGQAARDMQGRAPRSIEVIKPIRNGAIFDFEMTRILLRHFIRSAGGGRRWNSPRLLISLPTDVSDVSKNALQQVADRAGAGKLYLIDQPRAAGLGSWQPIHTARGHMIVDIGAGTTDISVLALGDVIASRSIPAAGDAMDEAIVSYIRKKYNIWISPQTAEEIKIRLGSAHPCAPALPPCVFSGLDLMANVPREISITQEEVRLAIDPQLTQIVDAIADMIPTLEAELIRDLKETGITLCGGIANLPGLPERLYGWTNTKVFVPSDPRLSVARGLAAALEHFDELRPLLECPEDRI